MTLNATVTYTIIIALILVVIAVVIPYDNKSIFKQHYSYQYQFSFRNNQTHTTSITTENNIFNHFMIAITVVSTILLLTNGLCFRYRKALQLNLHKLILYLLAMITLPAIYAYYSYNASRPIPEPAHLIKIRHTEKVCSLPFKLYYYEPEIAIDCYSLKIANITLDTVCCTNISSQYTSNNEFIYIVPILLMLLPPIQFLSTSLLIYLHQKNKIAREYYESLIIN